MKSLSLRTVLLLLILIIAYSCSKRENETSIVDQESNNPSRIVSLSPSTTEIIFSLGCGYRLVGVSRFCNYPPEAAEIPKVGGYLDPNYEALTALKPDLVLLLPEQADAGKNLAGLGIRTMTVDNKTVDDILCAIDTLGHRLRAEIEAAALLEDIDSRIKKISGRERSKERPRVLISIGHDFGSEKVEDMFAAGAGTYYDEILKIAGGTNTCSGIPVSYPVVSAEGIISMDPDLIIELVMPGSAGKLTEVDILKDWASLSSVKAVRNGRVNIIRSGYAHIPGPRFILLLEDMAEIIRTAEK